MNQKTITDGFLNGEPSAFTGFGRKFSTDRKLRQFWPKKQPTKRALTVKAAPTQPYRLEKLAFA